MIVGILNTKPTARADYLLLAVADGIRACGDDPVFISDEAALRQNISRLDVAFQVCIPNRHKSAARGVTGEFRVRANRIVEQHGMRIATLDTGFVRNQSELEMEIHVRHPDKVLFDVNTGELDELLDGAHYSIGFDGIKRWADYCNDHSPGDRWGKLGVPLRPWRKTGSHILLFGQTNRGISSQHVDIYCWYADVVRGIREASNRRIVLRQHPRLTKRRRDRGCRTRTYKDRQAVLRRLGGVPQVAWGDATPLPAALADCWATVAFTTNAAVESIVAGIPGITLDSGCMAWDVTSHSIADCANPPMPDRTQWVHDLAYAQWNPAEMRSGEAWSHLRPHARKPRQARTMP